MPRSDGVLAICAGGTGGHITPALAIVEALLEQGFEGNLWWFHTRRGEEQALAIYPVIQRVPLPLVSPRRPLPFALSLTKSVWVCLKCMRRDRPFALVATGGYTALPGVIAALLFRVPIIWIEVNVRPGRATRWLGNFARVIFAPAPRTGFRGRVVSVGVPVRRVVRQITRASARAQLQITEDNFVVTVTGGSQGASAINHAFEGVIRDLMNLTGPKLVVFHQTGERDWAHFSLVYKDLGVRGEARPYFSDLPVRLAASDLVVSRAGANTVAEIVGIGVPALVIPYPHAGGHQYWNAEYYSRKNAIYLMEQHEGWESEFREKFLWLVESAEARNRLREGCRQISATDAAQEIAREILRIRSRGEQ
ncbi:MAG: UDP-N-acetylglucosamine--N-acetylmuramyl-(pentapeptide) pyrophosphoryl-undecaprenol N-acetylglucosamine transferase [bacterium JZ-2024 1]